MIKLPIQGLRWFGVCALCMCNGALVSCIDVGHRAQVGCLANPNEPGCGGSDGEGTESDLPPELTDTEVQEESDSEIDGGADDFLDSGDGSGHSQVSEAGASTSMQDGGVPDGGDPTNPPADGGTDGGS